MDSKPVRLGDVGRHVSAERGITARAGLAIALTGISALICVSAFAGYELWRRARYSGSTPVTAPTYPESRTSTSGIPERSEPVPYRRAPETPTLIVTVTGQNCPLFVRIPGGDILLNRVLVHGQSVRFDDELLSVVLGDASAAEVHVNGRLRPPGRPGRRAEFTAIRH
jgi:hypothetical protein